MRLRPVPRNTFVGALVLGLATTVLAGPSAEDEDRRLADSLWFVEKLDKAWEPVLSDFDRSLAALSSQAPDHRTPDKVQRLADRARVTWAERKLKEGEPGEPRALELYELLAKTAAETADRPKHHEVCSKILMDQADRATRREKDDKKALQLAGRAMEHTPGYPRALKMIADLGFKVAAQYRADEQFEEAMRQFGDTIKALKQNGATDATPEVRDGLARIEEIRKGTGTFAVSWLGDPQVLAAVKGPKVTYHPNSTLRFAPKGGGKEPPAQNAAAERRLVRVGTFTVSAVPAGGGEPYVTDVEITPGGTAEITILTARPEGMLLVPPAGADEAFLIDRTEWSNAKYEQITGRSRAGDPRAAVAGISYADARRAAEESGRHLPTREQWTHAAFGSPNARSPRFPWGDTPGQPGREFIGGGDSTSAQDVESCREFPSRWGCLNMAGNVWEWIDYRGDGWLLGGGWTSEAAFERDVNTSGEPWKPDFLRDPLPTEDAYNRFSSTSDQDRYLKYQAKSDGATMQQAGFRCVVPLGKPRR